MLQKSAFLDNKHSLNHIPEKKKSVLVLIFLSNLFTVLTGSLSFSLKFDNIYQTYLLNYVPCKRKELFLPCFFPFKKVLRKNSSIINAPLVITVVVQI